MRIHDYYTAAGKNLIKEYLSTLPKTERYIGYHIRNIICIKGLAAFDELDTRQIKGKLWEIKFSQNRILYILIDAENIYMLHACKKQKGKAEHFVIDTALQRAKELGIKI